MASNNQRNMAEQQVGASPQHGKQASSAEGHPQKHRQPQHPQASVWAAWGQRLGGVDGAVLQTLPDACLLSDDGTGFEGSGLLSIPAESYDVARTACREHVDRLAERCKLQNLRFVDTDFNMSDDFKYTVAGLHSDCMHGLRSLEKHITRIEGITAVETMTRDFIGNTNPAIEKKMELSKAHPESILVTLAKEKWNSMALPRAVKRTSEVHKSIKGAAYLPKGAQPKASDVVQGKCADCWFLAAVASGCSKPGLIRRLCVAENAQLGIYGFVFYRDGGYVWTVIDDYLYLKTGNFAGEADGDYDPEGKRAEEHRKAHHSGSKALWFARGARDEQFWVSLLEKAYAKIHGDYAALGWGCAGEAAEDLTGGVNEQLRTADVADKNMLWTDMTEGKNAYMFMAVTRLRHPFEQVSLHGLMPNHIYSVLNAEEVVGPRGTPEEGQSCRFVWMRYVCSHDERSMMPSLMSVPGTHTERRMDGGQAWAIGMAGSAAPARSGMARGGNSSSHQWALTASSS